MASRVPSLSDVERVPLLSRRRRLRIGGEHRPERNAKKKAPLKACRNDRSTMCEARPSSLWEDHPGAASCSGVRRWPFRSVTSRGCGTGVEQVRTWGRDRRQPTRRPWKGAASAAKLRCQASPVVEAGSSGPSEARREPSVT